MSCLCINKSVDLSRFLLLHNLLSKQKPVIPHRFTKQVRSLSFIQDYNCTWVYRSRGKWPWLCWTVCLRQSPGLSSGCAAGPIPPGHPASAPPLLRLLLLSCPGSPSHPPAAGCRRIGPCASPACSPRTWADISPRRRRAGSGRRSPWRCTRGTGPAGSPGMRTRGRGRGRAPRCGRAAGAAEAAGRWSAGWSNPWRRGVRGSGCPIVSA